MSLEHPGILFSKGSAAEKYYPTKNKKEGQRERRKPQEGTHGSLTKRRLPASLRKQGLQPPGGHVWEVFVIFTKAPLQGSSALLSRRQSDLCELEASLHYMVRSRPVRETQ